MLPQSLEGEHGPNSILPVAFWPPALREQMPVVLIHPVWEMLCYCSPRNVTDGCPAAPQPTPGDIVSLRVGPLALLCSWDTSDLCGETLEGSPATPVSRGPGLGSRSAAFQQAPSLLPLLTG